MALLPLIVVAAVYAGALPVPGPSLASPDTNGPGRAGQRLALPSPELSFDLLGEAAAPGAQVDERAVSRRRTMLKTHQGLGIGLMVLELSTLVVGQLNYRDRFGGGARTGSFKTAHAVLGYSAFALFLTNESLALLAPVPIKKAHEGFDRATLHKVGLFTAAAGMLAEAALGIYTAHFASPESQRSLAKTHLFVGYGTYAAMAVGVSAFIF
jgi:hypothetical protein